MKKIGIKPNHRLLFQNAPAGFAKDLGELPEGATQAGNGKGLIDVAVLFVKSAAELEREFDRISRRLQSAGMFWVGWPKKSSGVATDLTEGVVQKIGLAHGLVDVKVCAIDETWSGLKFVIRLRDRKDK